MRILNIITALALMLFFSNCKKYDELQVNPNSPSVSPAGNVLLGVELSMVESPWSSTTRLAQFYALTEVYYGNQNYNWTTSSFDFDPLRNVLKMEEEAVRTGGTDLNPYLAIGKFFRAYFFADMALTFGDVPLTDALKAKENVFTPTYDSQKEVYRQILKWLDEANTDLTAIIEGNPSASLAYDMYYGGDLTQWRKVVNSFRLRTLISLSKRADDTQDLNIKQQFADIVSNPTKYPIISSYEDDLQVTWIDNPSNRNPNYSDNASLDIRAPIGQTYLELLKKYQDPRIFIIATPTDSAKNSGDPDYAKKFTSFRGANTGDAQVTMKNLATQGKLSFGRPEYFATAKGDPTILLGVSEVEFCIAEGINRGWASGDAASHYWKGIQGSMDHYNEYSPNKIPDGDINSFKLLPSVVYAGNNSKGLLQILEQKYVAFFQNSGWQPFFEQRRTGVPVFLTGPGTESVGGVIPKRWMYPDSENQYNIVNLQKALDAQYGGIDNVNSVMWLIK